MATCFLFTQHLTDESCLGLRLNDQGQLDAPLETRTFDAFRALQMNARTVVVVPTENSSLHQIELPWLGERKARAAIPYTLEEFIAQPIGEAHVAFDQQHYQNKRYLVAVIDKAFLQHLMARLDAVELGFHAITLDWFALNPGEACVSETSLLVRDDAFKGALSVALADIYLAGRTSPIPVLAFNDSAPALKNTAFTPMDSSFYEWVATRLLKTSVLNLCQGELQHDTRQQTNTRWYQASVALAGLWLVSFLVIHAVISHQLTNKIIALDQKIAVIYREFFPQARQVISPGFRVERLLKEGHAGQDRALWTLQDKLAVAINHDAFTIEQFRYQNQTLSVSLRARDFAALEGLQLRLQQAGVKVTQTQASSHEQQVVATLELRL